MLKKSAEILITRAEKPAKILAQNLEKKGYKIFTESLFKIQLLPSLSKNPINQRNLQALLITSQSAIPALKKLAIKKEVKILTVGKKTADGLKKIGYKNINFANDSATSLLELAEKTLSKKNGEIIYLSGEIITLDLAKALKNKGFKAMKTKVYITIPKKNLSSKLISKIKKGQIEKVLIYSKNSATIFYQLITKHNLLEYFKKIELLCFSKNILDHSIDLGFKKVKIMPKSIKEN